MTLLVNPLNARQPLADRLQEVDRMLDLNTFTDGYFYPNKASEIVIHLVREIRDPSSPLTLNDIAMQITETIDELIVKQNVTVINVLHQIRVDCLECAK